MGMKRVVERMCCQALEYGSETMLASGTVYDDVLSDFDIKTLLSKRLKMIMERI